MRSEHGSHRMLLEIHEEPAALRETLSTVSDSCRRIANELARERPGIIHFSGSGTSHHVALASNYLMSSLSSIPTSSIPASEYDAWVRAPSTSNNIMIAISQSGESVDVLSAVKAARRSRIRSIAVTNESSSPLAKAADFVILTRAGPEEAVTATKTFVSCLAASYLLCLELIDASNSYTGGDGGLSILRKELAKSPQAVQDTIAMCEDRAEMVADSFRQNSLFFLLGRGANYATALEGALKLKESSNLMAEGYAAREFLHGPMQLVDEGTPIVAISTSGDHELFDPLVERFRRLGAPVVRISEAHILTTEEEQLNVAVGLSEPLSPLAFIVPVQLFAYYSAVARGLDPDKPTKLTKVVR